MASNDEAFHGNNGKHSTPYVLMIVGGKISIVTRPYALDKIWPLFCPSLLNLYPASEAIHSRLETIWIPSQYSR